MSKKIIIGFIVSASVILGLGIFSFARIEKQNYSGPVEKMIIGSPLQGISSLAYLANEQGYFRENKLDVETTRCNSGVEAIQKLLDDEIDIAFASDFAFTRKSFDHDNLRVIGSISKADIEEFVVRKDSGISAPEDLRGKKVGIKRKTTSELYLGSFLIQNGLSIDDIEIVDLNPLQLEAALQDNQVDAIITWPPYAFEIKQKLGDDVLSWSAQSGDEFFWLAITTQDKITAKKLAFEKFFAGLLESEEFVKANGTEAKNIITNYLDQNEQYMDYHWSKHKFMVEFPQTLLLTLDFQARWCIQNKLTNATEIPNYMNFIYLEALKNAKPEAITIIR